MTDETRPENPMQHAPLWAQHLDARFEDVKTTVRGLFDELNVRMSDIEKRQDKADERLDSYAASRLWMPMTVACAALVVALIDLALIAVSLLSRGYAP